jgi:hypothetical protein
MRSRKAFRGIVGGLAHRGNFFAELSAATLDQLSAQVSDCDATERRAPEHAQHVQAPHHEHIRRHRCALVRALTFATQRPQRLHEIERSNTQRTGRDAR